MRQARGHQEARRFHDDLEKAEAKDLRKQLRECGERVVEIARKHGYEFTRKELVEALAEKWKCCKLEPAPEDDEGGLDEWGGSDTCIISERPGF